MTLRLARSHPAARSPGRRLGAGFSLIELLITVAIVATLAGGATTLAQLAARRSQEQDLRSALRQIREGIDAYKQAADANLVKKAADESGYPASLAMLVEGVAQANDPKGRKIYFLRRLPRDPMADPALAADATWGLRSYESGPDNPQPGRDVFDVHSLSERIGLDGRPYSQW
ncbi:type II secretion system protein [Methylibium sp.]|uniref:type II secretion system protein n=1 Tax=Methylibium sp. TaxID=2067992 RepID=UPI003D111DA5